MTPTMPRSLPAAMLVATLFLAACASGDDDGATDTATPVETATSVTQSPPATEPSATNPPATSASTTPAATSPNTSPASAPTTANDSETARPSARTIELVDLGPFDQPVGIASRPLDGRTFVVEQGGRVIAFDDLSNATVLDISDLTQADGERGLLGLAFHPDLDLAYINYIDSDGNTVVAEYSIDPATATFDRESQREVLMIEQPFQNHNGGQVTFGPDGLLYIGTGDGGAADDPNRSALDVSTRLGKILRIDPVADGDQPFTIPEDNPFVDVAEADPTIWSIGLRNPWRFAFDPVTGDLWIADVGQNVVEEIDQALAVDGLDAGRGLNFGWSAFEGNDRFNEDQPTDDHTPPVYTYIHEEGRCSISGGVRYRGEAIRELAGWYVFGDFCSGEIWALDPDTLDDEPDVVDLGQLDGLVAIMQGPEREIYAVSLNGNVARFSPAG